MDIDSFEWWYSEGEAPDEVWDEPLPSDELSDGTDVDSDAGDALDSDCNIFDNDIVFYPVWKCGAAGRQHNDMP